MDIDMASTENRKNILMEILSKVKDKAKEQVSPMVSSMSKLSDKVRGISRYNSADHPASAPEMLKRKIRSMGPGPDPKTLTRDPKKK